MQLCHGSSWSPVRELAASPITTTARSCRPRCGRARIVSGISQGTELQLWRGTSAFRGKRFDPELRLFVEGEDAAAYPLRLGYEWVGRVEEVGRDVQDVFPGELVHLPRPHAETQVFAVDSAAGLPFKLPDGLPPDVGTLLQTTTIALQAVHDASLRLGDRIAIFGLGAFGLLTVQLARLQGAAWIAASDPIPTRRALAEKLGADLVLDPTTTDVGLELRQLDGVGVDVAVEFSGTYSGASAGDAERARRRDRDRGWLLRRRRALARRGVPPQPADPPRVDGRVGVSPA